MVMEFPFVPGPVRDCKIEMVQKNAASDTCAPKQSPTGQGTTESLMLSGIGERERVLYFSNIIETRRLSTNKSLENFIFIKYLQFTNHSM